LTGQKETMLNDSWDIYVAGWMTDDDRQEVEDLMLHLISELSPEKLGRAVNGGNLCYALVNVAVGMILQAPGHDEGTSAHAMITINGLRKLVSNTADIMRDKIPKDVLTLLTKTGGTA